MQILALCLFWLWLPLDHAARALHLRRAKQLGIADICQRGIVNPWTSAVSGPLMTPSFGGRESSPGRETGTVWKSAHPQGNRLTGVPCSWKNTLPLPTALKPSRSWKSEREKRLHPHCGDSSPPAPLPYGLILWDFLHVSREGCSSYRFPGVCLLSSIKDWVYSLWKAESEKQVQLYNISL